MSKVKQHVSLWRSTANVLFTAGAGAAAMLVLAPLFAILSYLVYKGVGAINWEFLTNTPQPVGEPGGGMGNAILGSALILGIASVIGVPLGIGAGVYVSEFERGKYANIVRFTADVLNGVPSIVIGIAAYTLVVLRQGHFSALAGGIALGIMMVPTVARTTEEMLLMVPHSVREAALGLGVPQWRSTLSVVLRTARSGIITGVMLAFARVAGETAPLLFTAFGNQYWNSNPNQPTAALPLQIFTYAISPFEEWHRQAWAGALVLIVLIVLAVAVVRLAARRGSFAQQS
jgi:phosphate transport system permease protein